jgi:hypothetical protein
MPTLMAISVRQVPNEIRNINVYHKFIKKCLKIKVWMTKTLCQYYSLQF